MKSSVKDVDVVRELVGLLSAKGAAPRDATSCSDLVQYVAEAFPAEARNATVLAWLLLVEAVNEADPPGATRRHLLTAKHLLALGNYPEDIERDTGVTLEVIRDTSPRSSGLDPARWVTVRRKIAARAGGYGEDPSSLNPRNTKNLTNIAKSLWASIKLKSRNQGLATRLASKAATEVAEGAPKESSRAIATRRLRRMTRRGWLRALNDNAGLVLVAVLAITVVVSTVSVILWATRVHGDPVSESDPLLAAATGDGWKPGLGRTTNAGERPELTLMPGFRPSDTSPWFDQKGWIEISGDFADYYGERDLQPGTYEIVMTIELSRGYRGDIPNEDRVGGRTVDAALRLGLLPSQEFYPVASFALFARVDADNALAVWDGEPILMTCDCSLAIVPTSIRMYSDVVPSGITLDGSVLTTSAPIGYAGTDGVLHSGHLEKVTVVASLVVQSRDWG